MNIFKSMAAAFSLYSRIPIPSYEFEDEEIKYCMCLFPLVGAGLAVLMAAVYKLCIFLGIGSVMTSGLMTALPILYTGGIHMDGLLDTYDALCSYGAREKKLEILKDPHVGGFAVINCIVYILMTFVCWNELICRVDPDGVNVRFIYVVILGYVVSRILSAVSVLKFKKAKDDGMVSDISKKQDGKCFAILIIELMILLACAVTICGLYSLVLIAAPAAFAYYRYRSYKEFGGITGDTAGWFLQLCELTVLIAAAAGAVFGG